MSGQRRRRTGRALWFSLGLIVPLAVGASFLVVRAVEPDQALPDGVAPRPSVDIQADGPFLDGVRVTLAEAEARSPYRLPIPPNTTKTGELTGIWMDPGGEEDGRTTLPRFAFVWDTGLRFYVKPTELSVDEVTSSWSDKIAEEPVYVLLTVDQHPAIGRDEDSHDPANLALFADGLFLSFVGEGHSLDELLQLTEDISYESSAA